MQNKNVFELLISVFTVLFRIHILMTKHFCVASCVSTSCIISPNTL